MKVIHLISGGDTGGAKTHVHSLLNGLSRELEVALVCFRDGPFAEEARQLGIRTLVFPGRFFAALGEVEALIRSEGFELIHSHGSRGNLAGALLARRTRLPVVSTVHSDWKLDYLGRPLAAMSYGVLNAWALRQIKYHIGVSDAMRALLIERGFRRNDTFAIYNGIDFTRAIPGTDRAAFYKRVGARVLVLDNVQARLDAMLAMGADAVDNSAQQDVAKAVADFSGGEGMNLLFEATGSLAVLEGCINEWASPASRLVVLGFSSEPASIAPI